MRIPVKGQGARSNAEFYVLGVPQSEPSKLPSQSHVNVVALHTPLIHAGLQTVEK